ncbi:sensor histidine kinase [Agrococcus sp. SGAir0287]|uniref:sensor histidine kinase n=1 Tax=Agrococcus sp. SGAir0287 TaxID=2070347 RepID=UPI0010CD34F5|nr:HAMP domain-containing sensor histidine kinase [Agrococcus sp. SGAir0287]QCR19202.1 sensor histidine kinase [Agrococcus sp. SGAir0287]
MRLRVLLPLLVLGLLAVCAVVVPVAEGIAVSRTQQLVLQRASAMDQIVQRAATAVRSDDVDGLARYVDRMHATYGEAVLVVDAGGDVLASTGVIERGGELDRLLLTASRAVPQWSLPTVVPWSRDVALVAEPVLADGDVPVAAVVLAVDLSAARSDVAGAWTLVGLAGMLLLATLLVASLQWTRWVLRPVRALDAAATALAEHRDPDLRAASGPPELRHLTDSFRRMATSVEDALEQQRGFVADASHQLRNPLAAVRLRLDASPSGALEPETLAALDHDLDRLERTVDRMLELADAEHRATAEASGRRSGFAEASPRTNVTSAAALAEPWIGRLADAGQHLVVEGDASVEVACRRSDLEEMVEIALDNARKYAGAGATVRLALARVDDRVVVSIADDGPGLAPEERALAGTRFWRASAHGGVSGTGLGLAILRELARANDVAVAVDRATEGGLRVALTMGTAP